MESNGKNTCYINPQSSGGVLDQIRVIGEHSGKYLRYKKQNSPTQGRKKDAGFKLGKKGFFYTLFIIGTEVVTYDRLTSLADPLHRHCNKLPYYEVTRRFLLGVCYYRIGKEEQGKECMEYVIGHGNTLKCKEEAEKYVTV